VTIYNYVQGILREIVGACSQAEAASMEFTIPKAIHIALDTDKDGKVAGPDMAVGHIEFTILLVGRPEAACHN
jgi:hypothetical protein